MAMLGITTEVVAWYAAGVATLVLVWDVVKWFLSRAERRADLEAATAADLRGSLERGGSIDRLVISNVGSGDARKIVVRLDGWMIREHPAISESELRFSGNGPDVLGPGADYPIPLALSFGTPSPKELLITWCNPNGKRKKYRTSLSL